MFWQQNLPLVQIIDILYQLALDNSHQSIAQSFGRVKFIRNSKSGKMEKKVNGASVTLIREKFQNVCAMEQELAEIFCGGFGVECEADATEVKGKRKGNVGRKTVRKGNVLWLNQRDGMCVCEAFAQPDGGPERLAQVTSFLDKHLKDWSILCADKAKAYFGYVLDRPWKNLVLLQVNHSLVKQYGFSWKLAVTAQDGPVGPEGQMFPSDRVRIIESSTQSADGGFGSLKAWLREKRNVGRANLQAWVKEFQFRRNHRREDIFHIWLQSAGKIETEIRRGSLTIGELNDACDWNYWEYLVTPDVVMYNTDDENESGPPPKWVCTCGFTSTGNNWNYKRKRHKGVCRYYQGCQDIRLFEHETSNCACCSIAHRLRNRVVKTKLPRHLHGTKFSDGYSETLSRVQIEAPLSDVDYDSLDFSL